MLTDINNILKENQRRLEDNNQPFDPVTGKGSIGKRFLLVLRDFPIVNQWLPVSMKKIKLIKLLRKYGTINEFITKYLDDIPNDENREIVISQLTRLRNLHDFPFWAAAFIKILSKNPGEGEIPFRLSRPQRRFVDMLEQMRLADKPIRVILLKARQWGGSTTTQLYMAWLQLVHMVGLNSVIVSQTKKTSFAIKAMYDRALRSYPTHLLHPIGQPYDENETKMENVGLSSDYKRIRQRDCTITIASYEAPDALRGDAYALAHCSEVGLWYATERKSPESVVRSACSGVLYMPYTMIVYESTANGTGNFFHREYIAAKKGESQFSPLFISWFDIDQYAMPFDNEQKREQFAEWLYNNKDSDNVSSEREEPGRYLWWLWEKGATLEAINWYITERRGKNDHGVMAAEFPSDDIEAFVHSGARVFDKYQVMELEPACRPPKAIGDVCADTPDDKNITEDSLRNLRFMEDRQGQLWVWDLPDDDGAKVNDRYLVVVDIGGRSAKADWSVIVVFDRIFMTDGERPAVVAQWYGHIDMDLLAVKAAQIAAFYDNALLVIESNTLETHDRDRQVDGDQSQFILNQIKDVYTNLYARKQSPEDIRDRKPRKYGFHTNVATKPVVISMLVKCVRDHLYTERDHRCLDEMLTYERKQNGAFGAIPGHHDDLLMTRAIGLHICFREMPLPTTADSQNHIPMPHKARNEASFI